MKKIKFLLCTFTFSLLMGCVSYNHPSIKGMSEKSYAIVFANDLRFSITAFDGKEIFLKKITSVNKLSLPSGEHAITALYDQVTISTKPITKIVILEPGVKYDLVGEIDSQNSRWNFHIVSQSDGSYADQKKTRFNSLFNQGL